MLSRSVILSIVLIGGLSGLGLANERGSRADQDACKPDVHQLCDQYVPDEGQIVDCLKKEMRHLSPACKKVMSRS
jgi:hypothetical protein